MQSALPVLAVHYVAGRDVPAFLSRSLPILGVVGYGAARPDDLPPTLAYAAAPLPPVAEASVLEIWTTASACRPVRIGPVAGTCGEDFAFGTIGIDQSGDTPLEVAVERAYSHIFDFLEASGFLAPLRFWNYLTAITGDERGLERYRRFNIGRHRAFSARLRQPVPPAASAVGAGSGDSMIYFLAARRDAAPVENPRQISAYSYPEIYGPRSPSFSRASIFAGDAVEAVFISGTASIVGHETRHADDLHGQIAETSENLRSLVAAVRQRASASLSGRWAVKIYLKDPASWRVVDEAIDDLFGSGGQRLYLQADICRTGLLLEVEAFYPACEAVNRVPLRRRSGPA